MIMFALHVGLMSFEGGGEGGGFSGLGLRVYRVFEMFGTGENKNDA